MHGDRTHDQCDDLIDDLSRKAFDKVHATGGCPSSRTDFERNNARAAFQSALSASSIVVTREEFDVQAPEMLQRTRQRLQALEARVAALESGGETSATEPDERDGSHGA